MNYRDKLSQMKREYRRELSRLDEQMAGRDVIIQQLYAEVQQRFVEAQHRFEIIQLQLRSVNDELSANTEGMGRLHHEHMETRRTLQGRARLMEERFSGMLELVEGGLDEELAQIYQRLEKLEQRDSPAA